MIQKCIFRHVFALKRLQMSYNLVTIRAIVVVVVKIVVAERTTAHSLLRVVCLNVGTRCLNCEARTMATTTSIAAAAAAEAGIYKM